MSEATKDAMKSSDEKVARVTETVGELRSMAHQMDSGFKDQEMKVEKVVDITEKLEPEKLIMELTKRDQRISQMEMKVEKMDGMISSMNDIMKKANKILANIGSLESVINVSKEVNKRLHDMDSQINNVEKINDKLHGMFSDLSSKMEEWIFYRTKQDKIETMVEEILKNFENFNTKIVDYVTKDDLEQFRTTIASAPSTLPAPETSDMSSEEMDLIAQREEINSLMKSMDEEYANKTLSKEEYEQIKGANEKKLKGIESKIAAAKSPAAEPATPPPATPPATPPAATPEATPAATPPPATPPVSTPPPATPAEPPKEPATTPPAAPAEIRAEKPEDNSVEASKAVADVKEEMTKQPKKSLEVELDEMLKSGFISKKAYDKAKRLIGKKKVSE